MNTMTSSKFKFPTGRVVITQGADAALTEFYSKIYRNADTVAARVIQQCTNLVFRHVSGDWGCVCDEDKALNDESLVQGNRILSAYPIDERKPCEGFGDNCIWVITEADRSVTTLLLPEDY
jgi:hypothetical protein